MKKEIPPQIILRNHVIAGFNLALLGIGILGFSCWNIFSGRWIPESIGTPLLISLLTVVIFINGIKQSRKGSESPWKNASGIAIFLNILGLLGAGICTLLSLIA